MNILKLFLEARADKNPVIDPGGFFSVLHVAAQYGQLNITKWYKEVLKFPDINPRDKSGRFTPTTMASENGKISLIKYYIEVEGNYIIHVRSVGSHLRQNLDSPYSIAKYAYY